MGILARDVVDAWQSWSPPATWQADAACQDLPLDVFFPYGLDAYEDARAVCGRCEVIEECRAMVDRAEGGLPRGYISGMFAGESPTERIRRRMRFLGG